MRHISPEELIALHDANINRYGGLPGMSDPGRAEAIIGRVQARVAYEEITDLFEVSATYLVATARGHIFNDANKRTALNSALLFRHCCKVSDEAAFCLIQRPYISKTLLTRRISPRGSP